MFFPAKIHPQPLLLPQLSFNRACSHGRRRKCHWSKLLEQANGEFPHTPLFRSTSLYRFLSRFQASLPYLRRVHRLTSQILCYLFSILIFTFFVSISKFNCFFLFSFAELMEDDPRLAHLIFTEPIRYLREFDKAAVWAHVSWLRTKLSWSLYLF